MALKQRHKTTWKANKWHKDGLNTDRDVMAYSSKGKTDHIWNSQKKKKKKKQISYFEVKFSRRIALMIRPPSQLRIGKKTGGKFYLELNPAAT